ncbi:hypothetical protein BH23GEM4_BH23GEM4_09020 [soil metagenome]
MDQETDALDRFAGRVAHDFNNLLAAIKGASQMLLLDLPPDHPGRLDAALIDQAATRAGGLTQQLLAFTRRQLLQPQTFDINELLTETGAALTRRTAPPIDVALLLHPDPLMVHVDRAQLQRALVALADNAFEAMPRGGKLTLTSREIELKPGGRSDGVPPGRYARITVRDNGMGMDGNLLPRITEPFFTTKGEGVGRGLGLSTACGIVAQSGGCLRVVSERGDGTAVRICLPLLPAAHADEKAVG